MKVTSKPSIHNNFDFISVFQIFDKALEKALAFVIDVYSCKTSTDTLKSR